jgi:hypothetical protein
VRRAVVAGGAVVVLVVAGLLVARAGRDHRSSMIPADDGTSAPAGALSSLPPSGSAAAASAADPDADADGERGEVDVEGARVAAVAAVARTREVVDAGLIARRDVIASFATDGFAPLLAQRTSQQWVSLLFGLRRAAGRAVEVEVLSQPVTATAAAVAADRVAVQVWTVTVWVAAGESPAPEQWSTMRLAMVHEDGRWLVEGWESTPGPSPAPAPEGTFASDDEIAAVIAWPQAEIGERS